MKSGEVLEHLSCLHVDFEDTFPKIDGLVICPKCNRELKTLGSDYLRPGLLYKCLGCGDFTVTRKITFECRECGKTFDQPKIGLVPYYKYKLNPKGDADPHEAQSQDLSVLANRLESSGWQVRMNATVPGKSGVNHYFSMYLTLQEKKRKETCVVEVAKSDFEINTTPVLAFFAKALDVGAKHKVLLATPKLTPTAKKLASSYNMTIIESSDETRMVDNVWQALSSTSRHLQKSTKQPSLGKRRSLDIIADILAVSSQSVSKTEIMGRVNLSYEQCQKYIPMLEKLEFLRKYFEDGIHVKYAVTDKGRQYLLTLAGQFGTIVEGERSVWDARRSPVPT